MTFRPFFALLAIACLASSANAQSLNTTFSTTDGFITGDTNNDFTFQGTGGLTAAFSGGLQEQAFDGPSYASGNQAFFFVNGTFSGSFNRPVTDNTDIGTITFNTGVDQLSFFAADLANGTPSFSLLDATGATLLTQNITAQANNVPAAELSFDSATLGGQISQIVFDNAGPAQNPPYAIAIDDLSASVNAVPEPSSAMLVLLVPAIAALRRNRS